MSTRKNGTPPKPNSPNVVASKPVVDTPDDDASAKIDAPASSLASADEPSPVAVDAQPEQPESTAAAATSSTAPDPEPTPEPEATPVPETTSLPQSAAAPAPDDSSHIDQDTLRMLQEQARAFGGAGRDDREELTEDERRYLDSHLKANPLHAVNEHCFTDINVFKQMTITFYNLRANSKAFLSIRPDQAAIWSEGGESSKMVGLSFSTSTQPTLYLRNFLINAREMYLETYQDCSEINISLYVRTEQDQLKGRVDLPPGASVTMQSRCDRTSIIGLSSFGIDLE